MALGALDIIIAADTAQLRKGMDEAVGIMKSSTKTMESAAKTAAGAIAGYFVFDSIKGSIQHTLDFADSLSKMSQKVGVSVDALYAMQAAGKLADVNLETLEKSLLKFNKGLGSAELGTGNTANALKNLGISLKDSAGHLKTSDQYLFEVADRFKEMQNGIAKSTLAMELFGKSGADMIPLLNGGSEALKEYSGIINTETAQAAERFNDSMTKIGLSAEISATKILTGMLPTIESLSSTFEDMADWVLKNQSTIDEFTAQAGNDLTALGMVGHDAFNLISDTSGDMLKTVASVFNQIPGLMGRSSDDAIENFGFFEYFILGMSTATNGIGQFVANAKMAYATVAEAHAKYGSVSGLLTNGGYDAAKARMDYHAAELEAKKYTENVSETYNTLLGLKKEFKSKNGGSENPLPNFELENYDKPKTGKSSKISQAEKDAKELATIEQRMLEENINNGIKRFQDDISAKEKANTDYIKSSEDMYTKLNELSGNWYDNELLNTSKWVNDYIEKGGDIEKANEYLNASILKLDQKRYDEQTELAKKQWEDQNQFWIDMFSNINKAIESQFFDAMTGKFESFGSWLKDFWSSITDSMARGLSKTLADAVLGTGNSDGGIQNWFKTFSATGAMGAGSVLSADQINQLGGIVGTYSSTPGGTVIDSAGKVVTAGGDLSSLTGALGIGKLLSGASLAGIAASIATPFQYLAGGAQMLGLNGLAAGIGNFGLGAGSVFTGASASGLSGGLLAGNLAMSGALGGLGGYALGSLGDALFGSQTKAGSYGAIVGAGGAALGALGLLGPVGLITGAIGGSVLGSIIGGLFGKTKATGSGLYFDEDAFGADSAMWYTDYQKKSWFSKKSWTDYAGIGEYEKKQLEGAFDTYNYLLDQLGNAGEVYIKAGKYTSETFADAISKSFLENYIGLNTTEAIYSYWQSYAKAVDSTVAEVLTSSVGSYLSATRSFSEWNLGSGTTDQLKFTADYLSKDLTALENMIGVSGVTVDNFLTMYDEAIKNNFTPETVEQWNSLGEALMKATDANKSYTDSLKALTASQAKPMDMMISKVKDTGNTMSTYTNQLLVQVVKELKSIKTNNLFQTQGAI